MQVEQNLEILFLLALLYLISLWNTSNLECVTVKYVGGHIRHSMNLDIEIAKENTRAIRIDIESL